MDNPEKEFKQFLQESICAHGADDITSILFSTLYLEPDEISMDELAKKTGYSLASVSTKLTQLESRGLLRKTTHPGSKKIFVYMEKDLLGHVKRMLLAKHERGIDKAKAKLPEILESLKKQAKTEEQKKKVKIVEEYYIQIKKADILIKQVLDLLNKVE